jgi:hypothetical protein
MRSVIGRRYCPAGQATVRRAASPGRIAWSGDLLLGVALDVVTGAAAE